MFANKNICFSNELSLRQVAHMKDWSATGRVLFFVLNISYKAVVVGVNACCSVLNRFLPH